jgi:lipopolysaccharide biosynthesis glycosyltransferase
MQYLYTLVSSPKDNYYEQFFLSVTSLRKVMPNAEVVLLCDPKTKENLTGKRGEYKKLVNKVITAEVQKDLPQVEISRWIKTSMRRLVQSDFLFIDCDTIIIEDLSVISKLGIQFGACLDKHSLIDKHAKGEGIIIRDKQLGFNSYLSNRHINSGIIYCVDTPEIQKIFDRWHELWQFSNSKNTVRDQPSFNMAIYENSTYFTELEGIWNCQIAFNGLPYLANSKIIHYFASDLTLHTSPFILASNKIFNMIKETGVIPEEALKLLENPRAAFAPDTRIITGDDMLNVLNGALFESILLLYQKTPSLYKFINRLSMSSKKIAKFFLIKKGKKRDGGIKYYN